MGKDHRARQPAPLALRVAFGQGVPLAPGAARIADRPLSDYWQPADADKHMRAVRKELEDRREARSLGLTLEEYRAL